MAVAPAQSCLYLLLILRLTLTYICIFGEKKKRNIYIYILLISCHQQGGIPSTRHAIWSRTSLYPDEWKIKTLLFCGQQNHTNCITFLSCYCWWMNTNSRFKTVWLNLWTASHETYLCLVELSSAFMSDVTKSLTTGSINGDSPAVLCATVVGNNCCIWRAV